jgi:hypothetical protein
MDSKNPLNEPNNLSPEELFRILDAEKSDQKLDELDEFEREALEGLKMVKDRNKVFELHSKIDALLEEEDRKKALLIPQKNRKGLYYFAMAASVALIVGFFFLFRTVENKEEKMAMNQDKETTTPVTGSNAGTISPDLAPPPPSQSDEIITERKAAEEKEPVEKLGMANKLEVTKNPETGYNGNGSAVVTITDKKVSPDGTFGQIVNKEGPKTDKVENANNNTIPVPAEIAYDDLKNDAEGIVVTDNISKTNSDGDAYFHAKITQKKLEEESKKKVVEAEKNQAEAKAEKQSLTYYKDLSGGIGIQNSDTSKIDLAKNTATGVVIVPGTSTMSFSSGATVTTTNSNNSNTYTWTAPPPKKEVFAKGGKEDDNRNKKSVSGKKKKSRSVNSPAFSSNSNGKDQDTKTKVKEADLDKNAGVNGDIAQVKQEEKGVTDNETSVSTKTVLPEFPGGSVELNNYLSKSIHIAKGSTNDTKAYVSFVVNVNGSLSEIKIVKGLETCAPCRDSVIKAFSSMPKWKPGTENGKPVNSKMNLPVTIQPK